MEPAASHLIEALRDIGYSLESAIADVIDNAISASAKHVDIRFGWSDGEEPWIAILDDGRGMTEAELIEAMRPGSSDPLAHRRSDDLGRFGLGLKTASFSQCRELTVTTMRNGLLVSRQWDLDLVRERNQWVLRRPTLAELSTYPVGGHELSGAGTIVLWRQLDRLDLGSDLLHRHRTMNERMVAICEHIALVFHRFMKAEAGQSKIFFRINDAPIVPYDPFNAKHSATMHLGEERVDVEGEMVSFRPYILPHHSKVSAAEYEALGGKEGYQRGQGFYIYRNRRLIVHGTWFRMARQDALTKLARIQVDIPNTLDHLWTIDVRKSRAEPPNAVKRRFKGILERVRESAKRPYVHRGTVALSQNAQPTWLRVHHNDRISYSPNIAHPLLDEFRSDMPVGLRRRFDGLMTVLGASLPFPTLFNDMSSHPKETDISKTPLEALQALADLLYKAESHMDSSKVEQTMKITEPFRSSPDFINSYISSLRKREDQN